MGTLGLILLATFASIEHIPTDSRIYTDIDILKTSGLIRLMPSTSRPWTRAEAARLVAEADSAARTTTLGPGQQAALDRLLWELGDELARSEHRHPLLRFPVPDIPGGFGWSDLIGRARASNSQQQLTAGAVLGNRPGNDFCFYDRIEFSAFNPKLVRTEDPAGVHLPGSRANSWKDRVSVETELAYFALRLPWVRFETGRDEFVWGPGYQSSVMLSDNAPALDHLQLCASYRGFKYLGFTAMMSRWHEHHRFLSGQRLELSLWNRLTLGGAMLNVFAWDSSTTRDFAGMLNLLVPLYFSVANSSHCDNLLVGWDAALYLPQSKVYGQLFVDNYEFNNLRNAPNAVGVQAGAFWSPRLPIRVRVEYAAVTAFTYYHRAHSIMFENYLTPLGHELGPDADRILGRVELTPLPGWLETALCADYTRRGYFNRGDYLRKSYYVGQTLPQTFPARGIDSLGNVIEEVEGTFSVGPEIEVRPLRLPLHARLAVNYRLTASPEGSPGERRSGVDFALKVEYRY
uniref:Capsule assembly Wzi family protein n=1 Tax=candidate division WOR-3 bacterium TaxID=2052148 RepID=A0A7C4GAF9_UNCW3